MPTAPDPAISREQVGDLYRRHHCELQRAVARTVIAPRQLPVGALTARVGVPLFLLLMSRRPR